MSKTKIEWATDTWNPVTGCTPCSPGCDNCYARRMANRLKGRFGYPADEPFRVTFHKDRMTQPHQWAKPRKVFVCSMGDLFHPDVSYVYISQVLAVMCVVKHHTYMVLTKRPEIMREWLPGYLHWPLDNVWIGVTVCNQQEADEKIPILLSIPAAHRFVSLEPMLAPVDLSKWLPSEYWCFCGYKGDEPGQEICDQCGEDFPPPVEGKTVPCSCGCEDYEYTCPECGEDSSFGHWDTGPLDSRPNTLDLVIVGAESGPNKRFCDPDWIRSIVRQCQSAGVKCFVKQIHIKTDKGFRLSKDMSEWPEDLRVRQM